MNFLEKQTLFQVTSHYSNFTKWGNCVCVCLCVFACVCWRNWRIRSVALRCGGRVKVKVPVADCGSPVEVLAPFIPSLPLSLSNHLSILKSTSI